MYAMHMWLLGDKALSLQHVNPSGWPGYNKDIIIFYYLFHYTNFDSFLH